MSHDDLRHAGFKDRTRVAAARERLLGAVSPHDRVRRVPVSDADGRAVAETVTAPNPVPSYDRAAMDGYAVRAADTFGASDRSPAVLRAREADADDGDGTVVPDTAVRVHTGSELPDGADAVVMIEHAEAVGGDVEVYDAVAEGENVGDAGEDVEAGRTLYEPGHRLRPSDLGLLKSVGLREVPVREPPSVGVIPTGEELVQSDPDPGEIVETNGLTVSRLAERWGADAAYRDVVTDDHDALADAIRRDCSKDVVVTTGGSSVGERDLVPEVVSELGEVLVHGVALKPGHPVALGVIEQNSVNGRNAKRSGDAVEETPVVMLPGYPVACIVNAVQFLRPALAAAGGADRPVPEYPTTEARLGRKIPSEPGVRTYARVKLRDGDGDADAEPDSDDGRPTATPTRASGSGVLSSVALADGWVVVPEEREGIPADETVAVQNWEWSA